MKTLLVGALLAQLALAAPDTLEIPRGENFAPLKVQLTTAMRALRVQAVSIAVIDDYRIVSARAWGADPHALFQAASISKPVAATATALLASQGRFSLDDDVNTLLSSWKVPTSRWSKPVTPRMLYSHTSGLSVHGFAGYEVGAPVPTVLQVLNGESPAMNSPVQLEFEPGSAERYSGGGVTVEQLLLSDVTHEPFASLMSRLVLTPAGMKDSRFEQPLSTALAKRAVSGFRADGNQVPGRWHVYPELAAAGLWTTPTDLAKWAIEVARAKNGKSSWLPRAAADALLTPGASCFELDDANPGFFTHTGGNDGYQTVMMMNWRSGQGVVVMTNSGLGSQLYELIERSVARDGRWTHTFQREPRSLAVLAMVEGLDAALVRAKQLDARESVVLEQVLAALGREADAMKVRASRTTSSGSSQ